MAAPDQLTCADRVRDRFESRMREIDSMLRPNISDVYLIDDGTTDTVLGLGDNEFRYSQEYAAIWRADPEADFVRDIASDDWDSICDTQRAMFDPYGLEWTYVEPGTFADQTHGYWRYLISYGGPSEEFRFYCDRDGLLWRAEFWFLDWFDGARVDCLHDDRAIYLWGYLTMGQSTF